MRHQDTTVVGQTLITIKDTRLEFGDLVVITLSDGRVLKGVFCHFDSADDTYSGFDEIEIRDIAPCRSVRVRDISKIKKVA